MRPGWLVTAALLAGCAPVPERPMAPGVHRLTEPIRLTGSGRIFDFGGVELVGAEGAPDTFEGTAIRIEGGQDLILRNVRIRGFKVAIHATGVERLTIENCDLSGNWRQRLNSTPDEEASEDWLYGHRNDDNEWLRYGAGIYLDRCPDATIRNNVGRNGQNGICIARSDGARIYDNDFSFNSGWGLAMYRASRCAVSRNRFDWCIRGYSDGVYRRGQDSAGILVYEQCRDNVFAYNSATHGGDGFFLWAGHETLDVTGRGGSNNNLVYRNDFSHAAANGIEATFSVGNRFIENRLEECDHGIWAGYSSETEIRGNAFRGCGNGISIEHGHRNRILGNSFHRNGTAIHLWWDRDDGLFDTAYGRTRNVRSEDYDIHLNTFFGDEVTLRLADTSRVAFKENDIVSSRLLLDVRGGSDLVIAGNNLGTVERVGRPDLVGAENWWQKPVEGVATRDRPFALVDLIPMTPIEAPGLLDAFLPSKALRGRRHIYIDEWGPRHPADPAIAADRARRAVNLATGWKVTFHAWESQGAGRPPADWEQVKNSPPLEVERADRLDYRWPGAPVRNVPADHFATVASTVVEVEAGDYELRTISDDGIRVLVDGRVVIEDWTWHPPKTHTATVTLARGRHSILVEHFEIDGFAQVSVRLRPSP